MRDLLNGFNNAPLETIVDRVVLTPQDKSSYFPEKNQSGFSYLGSCVFDNIRATNPCHDRISICSAKFMFCFTVDGVDL